MKHKKAPPLAVTLLAARRHPDPRFRARMWKALNEWAQAAKPLYSEPQIRAQLAKRKGTLLEPFDLDDEGFDIAVLLAQAIFSKQSTINRLRIVGRQTIGTRGGLVLTRAMASFYSERFVGGRRSGWNIAPYFAPAGLPHWPTTENTVTGISAQLLLSEREAAIEIKAPRTFGLDLAAPISEQEMTAYSTIDDLPLSRLSLRVDSIAQVGWRVSASTPEVQIRLSGHLANGSMLRLKPAPTSPYKYEIAIKLHPVPDEALPCAQIVGETFGFEWIAAPDLGGPSIEAEDRQIMIAAGLAHVTWLDEIAAWGKQ